MGVQGQRGPEGRRKWRSGNSTMRGLSKETRGKGPPPKEGKPRGRKARQALTPADWRNAN